MIIGIPKEIKNHENRVGLIEVGVKVLVQQGHKVLVEKNAGMGCGIRNEDYQEAGAILVDSAKQIYDDSDMIVKVKEPVDPETHYLHDGQILFTFLHLAAVPTLAKELMNKKVSAIAYETIQLSDGSLPVLKPMSEVAGKMAPQLGAYLLQKDKSDKGKGVLLGGVPGVKRGQVTIVGGGVAGMNAAKIAVGMGADVTIVDRDVRRLEYLDDIFGTQIKTLMSNISNIEESVRESDLVIGAVLVTGAKAPKLVTKEMVFKMEPSSVLIDISIDQGGCIETMKPTTHDNPTFDLKGVIHYGVTNIPAAVARTSTYALTNVTFPYVLQLANKGFEKAIQENEALYKGVNICQGKVTYKTVADDLGLKFEKL
ncbi:MAG: alanine dehydrogenase [Deltaproteobacteria bacterium GWA2_38_16]|nr:MAG: alanine dehydrogenase [Deltaproteobacteria bacterium GWA2_38_16]OGQ02308.1 MAG: alanine dehydrogenase [Deltaproteobacteria bacterium RIFCSPHIGHO2_02_FULL_38_15]OGQ30445.1 MAG: alanine dehydrogenase [Deltaproteobacteria bacterium RIFCSPLOWO2_01_FULL_38_9]OGQ60290.1 MAG: alanine dehydrogenase [Deltaproteobacteria bacterium RIFCSPLOWO2_12_FULL_38_8]HBQ22076.1 alanine dehydrogenase [Deltaproteobacteria bacterium]